MLCRKPARTSENLLQERSGNPEMQQTEQHIASVPGQQADDLQIFKTAERSRHCEIAVVSACDQMPVICKIPQHFQCRGMRHAEHLRQFPCRRNFLRLIAAADDQIHHILTDPHKFRIQIFQTYRFHSRITTSYHLLF